MIKKYSKFYEDDIDEEEYSEPVKGLGIEDILYRTLDIQLLLNSSPEIFDFKKLTPYYIVSLLNLDPSFFDAVMSVADLSPSGKVEIVLGLKKSKLADRITITEEELKKLGHASYFSLLGKYFKKYARAELWEKLTREEKGGLFLSNPDWVKTNISDIPALTGERLSYLSKSKPKFVDKNISDYTNLSTWSIFWINMIKFDEKYKLVFLKNTNSCVTKSDVRQVVRKYPYIIKLIDAEILENSKLTCKEWILLIRYLINRFPSEFKDWKFSPEVVNIINLDLTAEMLTGKSTVTPQFTRALNTVMNDGVEEFEDEDTSF